MRSHFKKFFLLLVLFANDARAQIYPVQGSASLIPPYALRFSDYTTSTSERIVFNVLLADVTKAELHVRLRLSIVGQNLKIETKPEYIGSPITLQGGIPLRLTNVELSEYFDLNHLNFSGISKSELLKNGFLPEGFYQFCFEVYEYGRGAKVSSTICAPAWLILNDPPIVNVPRNAEKLKPLTPQNIIFQWTPRHTGSPNAAFTTEYEIKVVEVWPSNRNPNDAILTQPPIYETTTHSTTFIYGPDATQLELGRTYAFRVQARAMAGAEQLDLFKNNGFSETVAFVYGDACDAPANILSDVSPTKITLNWDASISQTGYVVQYRPRSQSNGQWYTTQCLIPNAQLNDLQPNTTYEYQAMATCGTFESNYGDIATITTPSLPERAYSCGAPLENISLDPTQIIPLLNVGDVVRAADFDVTTTKVTGSSGVFSGEGTVTLPFFNNARARVKFDGITVNRDRNSEKRMMKGEMVVIGPAIVPQSLLNSMDQLSQAMKIADSVLNVARLLVTPQPDPDRFVADEVVNVPAGIRNASYDVATGKIIIVDNNGKKQSLSPDKNYAITDGSGGGAIVAKNGGVEKVTSGEMGKILNRNYDLNLAFSNASESKYGIDIQKLDAMKKNYEQLDGTYLVPYKAVAVSSADPVSAALMTKNMNLNKIKFDQDGSTINATVKGENIALSASAKTKGENPPIIARMIDDKTKQETIVGKLNVIGYNSENLKLHIVPVNGTAAPISASDIEKQLNAIYSQAVVNWSVAVDATLKVDGLASPFDNGSSGALSTYTGDMKTVINAFLEKAKLENDNYYLFLVPRGTNTGETGYMPRSKQCGFIFLDLQSQVPNAQSLTPNAQSLMPDAQIVRTMAHELGHGAFTLEHTFVKYPALTQGTTDNLMDYGSGTTLMKYQWDIIHNPRIVLGLFESDEAGALITTETFTTQLKNANADVNENGYVLISTEPKMPLISVKGVSTNSSSATEISFRLKIEYRRDIRQDEDYFPATGWKKIKANTKWEIDFEDKIRGGKATLFCDYGSSKDTIVFHIRGSNPTEQAVKDYINSQNYNAWFVTRLIRQESNYRHFNTGTNYGPNWSDSQGCPNFGPPHGWGLMQLDLLDGGQRPTAQQLWSWKANVDRGYQFLNGEKRNMVNTSLNAATNVISAWYNKNSDDIIQGHADQVEGAVTYMHANSSHFDFDFGSNVTGQNRPFADAAWIKNYNGSSGGTDGYSGFYYLIKKIGNAKPFWDVQRINNNGHNYVEAVSNRAE